MACSEYSAVLASPQHMTSPGVTLSGFSYWLAQVRPVQINLTECKNYIFPTLYILDKCQFYSNDMGTFRLINYHIFVLFTSLYTVNARGYTPATTMCSISLFHPKH